MHRFTLVYCSALALSCAAHAGGIVDGGDINPAVVPVGAPEKGITKMKTNAISRAGLIIENQRVFPADFGDSGFPEFTAEPGFDALPNTFLPGTRVGFHAPQGYFLFTGDALEPVMTERLNVKYLSLQVDIGPAPSLGFDLAVQDDGGWHRHLSYTIFDIAAPLPVPGIYVLPMTLYSTDPNVLESEVFWLVFDYQLGDDAQNAAVEWVTSHLIAPPCPADLDGDGTVGPADLGLLLGAWGTNDAASDLNGDSVVGAPDLGLLLGAWSSSCDG